jgi:purine catabolism regulator
MPLVTVADVLHTALTPLPGGYTLAAGEKGLLHEVTWTVTARPSSPIFPVLKPGEQALAAAPALHQRDAPASLPTLLAWLAERDAAGLVLRGAFAPAERDAALAAADAHKIPLVLVGEEIHLADVERAVTMLVRERRDDFYNRTAALQEVQFQLADGAPTGRGASLDTIVRTLADLTHAPAALSGAPPALELHHLALPRKTLGGPAATMAELTRLWTRLGAQALAAWQAPAGLAGARATEPPVLTLDAGPGSVLLVAPVLVRERPAAALLLAVPDPPAAIDALTLARTAGVCALEMARSQAVAVAETRTEQRLRGEFLTDLLNHVPGVGDELLLARARALGMEIAPAYAVALVSVTPPGPEVAGTHPAADEPLLEAAAQALLPAVRDSGALFQVLGRRLAVLWPVGTRSAPPRGLVDPPERLLRLAADLQRYLAEHNGHRAAGGVGRAHPGVSGAARARQEAEQALWSAWHLFGGDYLCNYTDLGIYRLLLPLRDHHRAELRAFYEETLGALAPADSDGNGTAGPHAKLLETLDAFLAHGGNHSETAKALILHRNTLSYRLDRIAEVTGLDLNDPAVRFRAQVALCVRRIMQA